MNFIVGIIISLALSFLALWGITSYLGPDDLKNCPLTPDYLDSKCQKADAIIAISGGDTNARTNEAVRLYKNGWSDILVFSGAAQDSNSPSNALAMKGIAVQSGVPSSSILIEESARNTTQNAIQTNNLVKQNNFKRVIIVTSAYHQRRASILFEQEFENISVINHPVANDSQWSRYWWITPVGWWLAIGELVKIAFISINSTLQF